MNGSAWGLVIATFLASAVETVEAFTIVLAVGLTRGWKSALLGVGAALAVLAALVLLIGPGLLAIPINTLRLVVGGLLLIFGLQWLRKAILRASGLKAIHDEVAIFAREAAELREHGPVVPGAFDAYGFSLAFKGVFLEGFEVIFIVLTFGAIHQSVALAALGALLAVIAVVVIGFIVRAPLSKVPENLLKFIVGIVATTFGIFWGVEGTGVEWPGNDLAIVGILAFTLLFSLAAVAYLKSQVESHRAMVSA